MINASYFERWADLDKLIAPGAPGKTIYLPTGLKTNDVYISNNDKLERGFYIEFSNTILDGYSPQKIKGVDISVIKNNKLDPNKTYLFVKSADSKNDDAFVGFSVAVFSYLEGAKSEQDVLKAFEDVIVKYHDFFGFKKGLSKIEEEGLVAELLQLEEQIRISGDAAISSWCGSEKNKHDFIFDTYDVEIKATLNQEQDIIHVSNENQLASVDEKSLFLKLYVFDENDGGVTVSDCITSVFSKLTSFSAKKSFAAKVALRGINPYDYQGQYCFALEHVKEYLVDENFPKLTKSNIPALVYDVKYKVNISTVPQIKCTCNGGVPVYLPHNISNINIKPFLDAAGFNPGESKFINYISYENGVNEISKILYLEDFVAFEMESLINSYLINHHELAYEMDWVHIVLDDTCPTSSFGWENNDIIGSIRALIEGEKEKELPIINILPKCEDVCADEAVGEFELIADKLSKDRKAFSDEEQKLLDNIKKILSHKKIHNRLLGTYEIQDNGPNIIRLYYRSAPTTSTEEFLASIRNTLAHEFMHFIHHCSVGNGFRDYSDTARAVKEATADFHAVLYSSVNECVWGDGVYDAGIDLCQRRYNSWVKLLYSDWPYAYALMFMKKLALNITLKYSNLLPSYEEFGSIEQYYQVFEASQFSMGVAYEKLLGGVNK